MIEFSKIHEDERGAIFLLTGLFPEDKEVTLFITKKGYARGGCIHRKNMEYFCVLEGIIKYKIENCFDSKPVIYSKGQGDSIGIGKQHYFTSLTDSMVIEWGATPTEKKEKGIWRKYVDKINGKMK
jgi:mannose-6-phosphate isomerase-like protein (cupin superfamily)